MDERERKGAQLNLVAGMFRSYGRIEAHDLLRDHGITRLAAIIHTLRHTYGWDIVTLPRKPGHMASYRLASKPASYSLPSKRRSKAVWSCVTCGQTALDGGSQLGRQTPTMAIGFCGNCDGRRTFRLR